MWLPHKICNEKERKVEWKCTKEQKMVFILREVDRYPLKIKYMLKTDENLKEMNATLIYTQIW